ncbi:DUF7379 domain-containing protein [Pseudorhodoferax sp.]|uniref:DUF7379 domain-containing protein n=1 Tax=Pseudorhodoferax sp. TaxID=1993553 RepID=UPI002DD6A288|nr:CHAT domain-containing protein [Pseudorhodoferax sp.]
MPIEARPSGLIVEPRGGAVAEAALPLPRAAAAAPRRRGAAPSVPATEEAAVVAAFEDQQLELVEAVPLVPPPAPAATRRRGAATAQPAAVDLTVPLAPGESAAVLVERDGVYEWLLAGAEGTAPLPAASGTRRRRGAAAPAAAAPRTLRFTVALAPAAAPAAAAPARRGGLRRRLGLGRAVAYVFRFVARPVLGATAQLLERQVSEGLVHVRAADPQQWVALDDSAVLDLPTDRPARVLLLVHGTFSSTVGSFGALAGHAEGQALLGAALQHYDAVLGWDHRTLSVLPTVNAVELAGALERLGFAQPPQCDAIAFSRGGLVLRSLVEQVLPASTLRLTLRRAVFTACTNGGTELARPANWHRLVDRYMNVAAAGARAAALVPGFASAGLLLASAIRGLGGLVKVLASAAVTDEAVPGVAAMDPGGPFVREINGVQPGQPEPQNTYYCAITSDFDPDTAAREAGATGMSPSLLLKLADKATDALLGQPNDLVVHVASMTQIDVAVGSYVRERLDYGRNGLVHHCSYFAQPRTAQALAGWLELPLAPAAPARRAARRRAAASPAPAAAPAAPVVEAEASRVLTLRASQRVQEALARVQRSRVPWLVVERPYTEGGQALTLRYAYPRAQGMEWLQQMLPHADATVLDAMNLRESGRSTEQPAGGPPVDLPAPYAPEELRGPFGSRYRAVVVSRGQAVDVVAPDDEATAAPAPIGTPPVPVGTPSRRRGGVRAVAAKPARMGRNPGAAADREAAPPPTASAPLAAEVECQLRAETDDEVVVEEVFTVVFTVAREQLALTAGREGAKGSAKVKAARPLIVECLPMLRVAMVDVADARVQIPVPAAGEPAELRFDLVGQEAGAAELRVQVRQGPLPLATLVLRPTVVARRSGTRRPLRAQAALEALPATLPRATDELRIAQLQPTGGSMQYRFTLELPSAGLRPPPFESQVKQVDPVAYVASLYRRIEDRWTEHKGERAAFERDLRAIGAEMFDELFPLELRQLLWQHRETIQSVQVLSTEPFIPWELVHVRDPATRKAGPGAAFLGEMGVVRWLLDGYPPERLRLRPGKARYVVPAYPPPNELPKAQDEIDLVERLFKAKPVEPLAEDVYTLLEQPGQFDLLHMACHGLADPADIDGARLEMPGRPRSDGSMSEEHVLATTVANDADLIDKAKDGEWRPIVVLNACQSLRGGQSLRGTGGFAQALVRGGAGVIVGSAWSVGDMPAYGFIEAFYKGFLGSGKRLPLAQAVAQARQKAREDGDATWLAYVVYGHPRATVPKG